MDQDRRLLMVMQGDTQTTDVVIWMNTPCEDHGSHTVQKKVMTLTGITEDDPWLWAQGVARIAQAELCGCDTVEVGQDVIADILGAYRG